MPHTSFSCGKLWEDDRGGTSADLENQEPFYGTYETEDVETGGTVAHRTESRNRSKTRTVSLSLSHEHTYRGPSLITPQSELARTRMAILAQIRVILAEARLADGRDLWLRVPLSSPPSVIRLRGLAQGDPGKRVRSQGDHSYAPIHEIVTSKSRARGAPKRRFRITARVH